MRTSYARAEGGGGSSSPPAPRGLQKVLFEDQLHAIIRRETLRADRTGQQFSVVLFSLKAGARSRRRWSLSTCRMARVLLSRVRQTDDVGWFDDRHLCAVLPDTPVTGARTFAARTCEQIARRQPRPTSVVYGYPGVMPGDEMEVETIDIAGTQIPVHSRTNGNGNGNGNGNENGHGLAARRANGHERTSANGGMTRHHSNGNGNGHTHGRAHPNGNSNGNGNGNGGALALVEAPVAQAEQGRVDGQREQLAGYFLDGVSAAIEQPEAERIRPESRPDAAVEDLFVQPMPAWKRGFDLVGASVGLMLLAPLLAAAAVAIKLTSPGPVIFRQRRSGLGGRPFTIYKFRTMCVGAERKQDELRQFNEQDGPAFKLTRDPRVTRVGNVLRKTSIDELPQLLNVLKGDMSLVGPRPLPVAEQGGCEQWQRHRLNVTPGLTCIWQVDGRSEVTFDEWVRMDVKYMRRQSLWHDVSIILRTIPAVLFKRGAK